MSKTVPSVKLQAYSSVDLDRLSYRGGDVVYDKTNGTLRVMNGETPGGSLLATRAYVLSNGGSGGGTVNSGVSGKLAYYSSTGTIVDDLSSVGWSGSTLSVTGSINVTAQKNYVRFHWDTLTDLNTEAPAATWHGMVAHVHETGRLYVAHSASWLPLALLSDVAVAGIQAGTNITVSNTAGVYTINATGSSGGGITLEEAQDGAASLFSTGSHTGIAFSYNDTGNSISATVGSVTLGTGTSGNYVANVQTGSGITGGSAGSAGAALTLGIDTAIVSTLTAAQTLTNKTISGASNTISNIGNGALTNSSITINGTSVSLGGTISISSASTLDGLTDVTITTPSTGQVLKYNGSQWINDADATAGGAGAGTVTSVSVTSANGFTGTVATASSTPAITITTSITGVLKGNATAISAAVSGTDYAPGTSALATGIVKSATTTGALTIAVAGTDYQAPIGTISGIVKGNGANALTAATAGTDYQAPIGTISGIVKGNGANALTAATAGTDYQAPITLTTTGSSGAATFSSGTLNIPQYAGGGASTFSGLSDATSAALTVDEIYLQATTRLIVTANGSSAYLFDQYTGNNPTIYATSGTTIAFDLGNGALSSHPFLIRYSGANYNTGLTHVTSAGVVTTGSSAQGKTSGTLYWKIPADISGTYGYLCSNHGSMVGVITINPATVTATSLSLGNVTNESKATMFTSPSLTGTASLGTDQTDYLAAIGGGGTARLETAGGTANSNLSLSTKGTGSVYFWRGGYGGTESVRIDGSGNLGIGGSTSASLYVARSAADAATNALAFVITRPGTADNFYVYYGDTYAPGGSNAVVKLGNMSVNNRSINASGTINASGSDYAEYMTKASNFVIAKGDVVGIDINGKLTNVFADAISFVVKSTDPSFVGGDGWSTKYSLGLADPTQPTQLQATEEVAAETDQEFAIRQAAYQAEKAVFDAALESARQLVDRVAFAGQVPVNVTGATPGQYIIPVNDNGAIKGQAVSNPTFEQYQFAVGKVIAVESDGRARIIVKVS